MGEADQAILEDASGRISIRKSEVFKVEEQVTGSIIAILGKADASGYFNVIDTCTAGISFKPELPRTVVLGKRALFDNDLLLSNDRKFIALTSGLNFGGKGDIIDCIDALAQLGHFLRGNHQFEKWNLLSR